MFQLLCTGLHPIFPEIPSDGLAVHALEAELHSGQRDSESVCQLRQRNVLIQMRDQILPDLLDGGYLIPGEILFRCREETLLGTEQLE